MKKLLFMLILILVLTNLLSAEMIFGNVHCKLIDSQTKKPISGVAIGIQDNKNQCSRYTGSTNENGDADLGVSHTNILIYVQKSGYVSRIINARSKENTIKLYKKSNVSKSKSRNDLELVINNLLESTEYATLSYKITRAIINGKTFIEVGTSLLSRLPSGTTVSIPGFFEMKLRIKNGNLGWVLDGALVREFVSLGIIPTQPNSFGSVT